jgi:hypothetical protein
VNIDTESTGIYIETTRLCMNEDPYMASFLQLYLSELMCWRDL